ncbi:hypothetical protein J0871_16900 [Salegentibacter sp. BDJ18]|uniref:hypothetical protein n=1 Tax=Salegentibacter sp. BDJ18 TaxID=2816376 RepID=UPI001AAFA0EE|nr:hypothetical protein [Salegentibacter sp. BDJ18]MBO2546097.1 hypothetical protein [Salegentibacter sp. BDJ18]
MKNDVLEFLASDNEKPQEKFNKALRLYRSSKNNDESQVRFMNRLGYSPARLEDLLYQLKTLHGITDVELATERNKGKKAPQPPKGEQNAPDNSEQNTEASKEVEAEGIEKDDQEDNSESSKDDQKPDNEASKDDQENDAEDQDKSPEKEEEPKQEVPEAIQKLDGFDVEAADYNTIKSFAAELGDAIKKTPKDQKAATLKAFISEAKKKHSEA